MTAPREPELLTSRDNPLLVKLRKLAQGGVASRKLGQAWIEGDHLLRAALDRGLALRQLVIGESAWQQQLALRALCARAERSVRVPDAMLASLSTLESPAAVGGVIALPSEGTLEPGLASVVLDRLQDAGNVGSILRSAAALGVRQVLAVKGTVALWSTKVLRAGMGAHFGLRLVEALAPADLDALGVPLVATSSHASAELPNAELPRPCAWVLGHEGQGLSEDLESRCALTVRIPQPGGEESLNVAAAAAICFYESVRRAVQ